MGVLRVARLFFIYNGLEKILIKHTVTEQVALPKTQTFLSLVGDDLQSTKGRKVIEYGR